MNEYTGVAPGIWGCNDCGASGPVIKEIVHHATCQPGESERWREFYNQEDEDGKGGDD